MHHSLTSRPTVTQYASACNVADTGWSKKRGTGIEPATIRAAIERSATELPARRRGRNGIAFTITTYATRSHAPSLRRALVNPTLDSPDSSDRLDLLQLFCRLFSLASSCLDKRAALTSLLRVVALNEDQQWNQAPHKAGSNRY